MDINTYRGTDTPEQRIVMRLSDIELAHFGPDLLARALDKAAEHIAAVFLETHQNEILAKLDPQAVANLAIAASGAAVRDVLAKKLPDTERVIERAVVYQRGVFGGLRRL